MRFERFFDKKSRAVMVLVGAAATLCIVWLVANLASGEKRIDHRIEHLYGVEDPRFLRTMGVLLGPPVVAGNRYIGEWFAALLDSQASRSRAAP